MSVPAIITDVVVAAVMVLCVLWGAKRGLFKSLMGLIVLVLALVVAARAANLITDTLIEKRIRPATKAAIEERVDEIVAESSDAISPAGGDGAGGGSDPKPFIREKALELLDTLGLSETEEAVETSARETLIELGYQVADTVIDTVVRSLLYTLSYLVCFLLGNLILRLLAKLLNVTFKLPGLHGLNSFGGGVLGLAEGWLLTTLALWLLMAFSDFMTEALIQETFLARFLFLTHFSLPCNGGN